MWSHSRRRMELDRCIRPAIASSHTARCEPSVFSRVYERPLSFVPLRQLQLLEPASYSTTLASKFHRVTTHARSQSKISEPEISSRVREISNNSSFLDGDDETTPSIAVNRIIDMLIHTRNVAAFTFCVGQVHDVGHVESVCEAASKAFGLSLECLELEFPFRSSVLDIFLSNFSSHLGHVLTVKITITGQGDQDLVSPRDVLHMHQLAIFANQCRSMHTLHLISSSFDTGPFFAGLDAFPHLRAICWKTPYSTNNDSYHSLTKFLQQHAHTLTSVDVRSTPRTGWLQAGM